MLKIINSLYYTNKEMSIIKIYFMLMISFLIRAILYYTNVWEGYQLIFDVIMMSNLILLIMLLYGVLIRGLSEQEISLVDYINRKLLYQEYKEYSFVNNLMNTKKLKIMCEIDIPEVSNLATLLKHDEIKNYLIQDYLNKHRNIRVNYKDIVGFLESEYTNHRSYMESKLTETDKTELNEYGLSTVKNLEEFQELIKGFEDTIKKVSNDNKMKDKLNHKEKLDDLKLNIDRVKVKEYIKKIHYK